MNTAMKRIISLILTVCMVFVLMSGTGILATAASLTRLPDISSFDQELTYAQYNALRTGTYTAENRNGVWYYKFTTEKDYVYIPISAFTTTFQNNFTKLNVALTEGVANTSANRSTYYVYKSRSDASRTVLGSYPEVVTINTSSTYITYLKLYSSLSGHNVTLQCNMNGHALFQYSDRVFMNDPRDRSLGGLTYVTPSTADQYVKALTRTTGEVSNMVTPQFTLSVDKAGTNKVILKEFSYEAVSSDSNSNVKSNLKNATKLIDVIMAVGKVTASSTPAGAASTLYSLFKTTLSFEKTSGSYYKTSIKPLSQNGKYCLNGAFTSPFKLKSNADYWQVNINLNDSPSIVGTKTKLSVSFSASPG